MEGAYPVKPQTIAWLYIDALHIIRHACGALLPSGDEFRQEVNLNGNAIWSRLLGYTDISSCPEVKDAF